MLRFGIIFQIRKYMKGIMDNQDVSYKVPILEKGLSVLEYLSLRTHGETLQNIKNKLDISQTTAYRLLNAFVRLGYLRYNEETKRYALTCKLLTLGFQALGEHRVVETVLPHLRTLRDRVKETTCFGVLGEQKGILIDQALGHHTFSFNLSPGKPFELHCSAPGKAIMAYLPPAIRNQYLDKMEFTRYNENTITTRNAYLVELEQVMKDGYAMDREEELSGVICLGSAILNYSGYPCGAIWISGPKDRLTSEVIKRDSAIICEYARFLSEELGYSKN